MRLHFVSILWGRSFVELYLRISLPAQLTAGNLRHCARGAGSIYQIYTTAEDAETITADPAYQELARLIETDIVLIDGMTLDDPYAAIAACSSMALRHVNETGAALFYLPPDAIWSEGSFANALRILSTGKRAVMVAGLRAIREGVVSELARATAGRETPGLPISSRELVGLALRHLHPVSASLIWGTSRFSRCPSHLYWPVGADGIVARCFHLHPMAVRADRAVSSLSSTVDDAYVALACPDLGQIHVVDDSDEICVVELSPEGHAGASIGDTQASAIDVARWARVWANRHHRHYVRHAIRMHATPVDGSWRAIKSSSDLTVLAITLYTGWIDWSRRCQEGIQRLRSALRVRTRARQLRRMVLGPRTS